MRDNTHITVVLDKSGSMDSIKNDTIGGFNSFLNGQKKTAKPGDTFSLVQFCDGYHYTYKNHNILEVPELSKHNYTPGGSTALLLTLTHTINELGDYFRSLPEASRPGKVVFVILTDGEENASNRGQFVNTYSKTIVKSMIEHQTRNYSWEFLFLGANQDAISEGASYGVSYNNSMSYGANKRGLDATFDTLTRSLNSYKCAAQGMSYAASGGITAEDRLAATGGDASVVTGITPGTILGTPQDTQPGAISSGIGGSPLQPSKTENVKDDGHTVTV